MPDEKLYSVKEVSQRYGLSVAWVYRCQDLRCIAFKVGKYLRWRESDLLAMEEYRRFTPSGFDLAARKEIIRRKANNRQQEEARKKLLFDIK